MQSGRTAARNVVHTVRREGRETFRYRNKGDLATIGRYKAVGVPYNWEHLTGWFAHWDKNTNAAHDVDVWFLNLFHRAEAFTSLLWDGVYSYSYVARATTPGAFVVPPPKAEEMYHPETFGRGASDRVVVE